MKFKRAKPQPVKKPTPPKAKLESKDSLRKEEIREVVEETVEALLKDQPQEDKTPSQMESLPSQEEATPSEPTPIIPVVSEPIVVSQDTAEVNPGSTEVEGGIPTLPVVSGPTTEAATPSVSTEAIGNPPPPLTTELSPSSQDMTPKKAKKASFLPIVIVVVILLGLGVGLWYGLSRGVIHLPKQVSALIPGLAASPTPARVVSLPSPSPSQVDISKYTIAVLNGSGIAGTAAKAKATLTNAGFTVSSTDNAATSDYTQTVVAVKSTVDQGYVTKLIQALKANYAVSPNIGKLPDPQSTDVIITIGRKTQ